MPVCPHCWPGKYRQQVDAYIAKAPKPAQSMMNQIRAAIKSVAPTAQEYVSYGLPFYEYKFPGFKGRLTYFGAFKSHIGVYAWGALVDKVPGLKKYKTAKSSINFPIGTKVPITLVKKVVLARKKEIDAEAASLAKSSTKKRR